MVGDTNQPLVHTNQFIDVFHIILWRSTLRKQQWAVYLLLWHFINTFFFSLPYSAISQTFQILIVICCCHTKTTLNLTSCSAQHMSVMNTARSPKTTTGHRWIRRMHQLDREDIYLIYCGHDGGWHTTPQTEVILHLCRALEHCRKGCLSIPGSFATLWTLRFPFVALHLRLSTQVHALDRFQIFLLQCLDSSRC